MTRMLHIEGLTKKFGLTTVVDDITFSVDRGEVLGFLGPNGAGKTTTMRMITGYLPPTAGTARVGDFDVSVSPTEIKKRLGYLPEGAPLYEDMTPIGLLNFVAELRGMGGAEKQSAVARAADLINIRDVMYQPIGTLSKGFKRRVGLAQAILHDPEVLILDEPTDGLDPNQKHEVRQLINDMAENKAIVISTHLLEEVEAVCTRAIIIARGKVVADGAPLDLLARSSRHNAVSVRIKTEHREKAHAVLQQVAGVSRIDTVDHDNGVVEFLAIPEDGSRIIDSVNAEIQAGGLITQEVRIEHGRLDEVFRSVTTS